jgi:hypothetical protein
LPCPRPCSVPERDSWEKALIRHRLNRQADYTCQPILHTSVWFGTAHWSAAGTESEEASGSVQEGERKKRGDYTQLFQKEEEVEARRNEAERGSRAGSPQRGGGPCANHPLQQVKRESKCRGSGVRLQHMCWQCTRFGQRVRSAFPLSLWTIYCTPHTHIHIPIVSLSGIPN